MTLTCSELCTTKEKKRRESFVYLRGSFIYDVIDYERGEVNSILFKLKSREALVPFFILLPFFYSFILSHSGITIRTLDCRSDGLRRTTACSLRRTTACSPRRTTACSPRRTTACSPRRTTSCSPRRTTSCSPPTTPVCGPNPIPAATENLFD